MQRVCESYQGRSDHPASFDQLHRLISEQWYRLVFWKVGPKEINYRRFFDVTQLISLRMERSEVFSAAHRLVFELLKKGAVTGLRIDHPDGLWDPCEYFCRLQTRYLALKLPGSFTRDSREPWISEWLEARLAPLEKEEKDRLFLASSRLTLPPPRIDLSAQQRSPTPWPLYVVAEKILSNGERLRRDWPIEGTTGYDFLNRLNGIFVQRANRDRFDSLYRRFTGNNQSFGEAASQGKRCILQVALVSELNALTHRLKQLAARTRYGQDFTFGQLHAALLEIVAAFPVYRTYVSERSAEVMPIERAYIEQAVSVAGRQLNQPDPNLLGFVRELLLLRNPPDFDEEAQRLAREFVMRFQQLTGPVTAKGLEDTAFYDYNRLVSLNEVGGDPDRFGWLVQEFHRLNMSQAELWPHSLLATATHDTKRGEDVRARINVLSEMPEEWAAAVERWTAWNVDKKTYVDGQPAPDRNDEYLLYQTLVGAWPINANDSADLLASPPEQQDQANAFQPASEKFGQRIVSYLKKAMKESKRHTTWTEPDLDYERAGEDYVRRILDPSLSKVFLEDFRRFERRVAYFGQLNSLAQVLIKTTAPGVPDFYQGTELWDLTLVDPDNRRPVDYAERRRLLAELRAVSRSEAHVPGQTLKRLLSNSHTGQIKMYVINQALMLRRQLPELFRRGAYCPISVIGQYADHLCAFGRVDGEDVALTVVPRLVATLTKGKRQLPIGAVWNEAALDLATAQLSGRYRNVVSGEDLDATDGRLAASDVLRQFPVALFWGKRRR
jgi:(1->4)-alpha-D-glucan 1-alpha-D-glucosylmutase